MPEIKTFRQVINLKTDELNKKNHFVYFMCICIGNNHNCPISSLGYYFVRRCFTKNIYIIICNICCISNRSIYLFCSNTRYRFKIGSKVV